MAYQAIIYEKRGPIARITLNRPEKLNAINAQMSSELLQAFQESETDPEIHVTIIKGAGRAFSSGYDITPTPEGAARRAQSTLRQDMQGNVNGARRWLTVWNLMKPTIAQVHGHCVMGATDFALHCDIVVCAEDAKFSLPGVRALGSPPTHMWTYLVGPQWAKRMLLTGDTIDGKTAERIGLVLEAAPADQLEARVNALAESIAKIPVELLAANKSIVNKAIELMGHTLLQVLAAENNAIAHVNPTRNVFHEHAAQVGLSKAIDDRDRQFER